jgi:hypothetical protein
MTTGFYVLASVLLLLAPTAGHAQSCTPVDSTLAMPLVDMKELVVSADPVDVTERQQLAIPAIDSAQVTVVSDTKVCDKVLAAFKSSLPAGIPLPTSLFVMKVGTVYVALYRESVGEADVYRVVSRQYAILSRYAR